MAMAFLPVLLLTFIAHSGLGASDEARRQEHNHRLSSILVHNNRASSLLSRFWDMQIPTEAPAYRGLLVTIPWRIS